MGKDKSSNTKVGRPSKLSYEDKINVITRYAVKTGGEFLNALTSYGVFSRLAAYAVELGYENVHSYDFSNDKNIRAYLDDYIGAERKREEMNKGIGDLAYVPLDIGTLVVMRDKAELRNRLELREQYVKNLYFSAATAIENFRPLEMRNTELVRENIDLSKQVENLTKELEMLSRELRAAKHREKEAKMANAGLKRKIKDQEQIDALQAAKDSSSALTAYTSFASLAEPNEKSSINKPNHIRGSILTLLPTEGEETNE